MTGFNFRGKKKHLNLIFIGWSRDEVFLIRKTRNYSGSVVSILSWGHVTGPTSGVKKTLKRYFA